MDERPVYFDKKIFVLLAFSLIIAMFLVNYTQSKNQAEWWDSAEYLLLGNHFANPQLPTTGFAAHREIIPALVWTPFFMLGLGEIGIHVFMAFICVLCVYFVFLTGQEMFGYKTGILSAIMMAVSQDYLFYTTRLTMYIFAPCLSTAAIYFFWKFMHNKGTKNIYISFLIIALGMTIYYNLAFALLIIGAFFVIANRKMILNKHIWISGIICILILMPYFIYNYNTYGHPIPRYAATAKAIEEEAGGGIGLWDAYLKMMPALLTIVPFILFIGGLALMYELLLAIDMVITGKETKYNKDLFLLLWIIIPLIIYTYVAINQGNRGGIVLSSYLFITFPAIYYIASKPIIYLSTLISKYEKTAGNIFIVVIMGIIIFTSLSTAYKSITVRLPAYAELKPAGEWIKQNTQLGDVVVSASVPQLTYYSERYVTGIGSDKTEAGWENETLPLNPKYLILTAYEPHPQWVYDYPQRKGLVPIKGFPSDESPQVIIFKFEKGVILNT